MSNNREVPDITLISALQTAIIPRFKLSEKDTIPISFPDKVPRSGTIWKESHSEQLWISLNRSFLSAVNLILSLGILPYNV